VTGAKMSLGSLFHDSFDQSEEARLDADPDPRDFRILPVLQSLKHRHWLDQNRAPIHGLKIGGVRRIRLVRQRSRRLRRKLADLHSTTGSRTRALYYVAKYVAAKLGFLAINVLRSFRRRKLRAEIAIARDMPGTVPLIAVKPTGGMGDRI
jgi:hypothetical protein